MWTHTTAVFHFAKFYVKIFIIFLILDFGHETQSSAGHAQALKFKISKDVRETT